MGNFHCIDSGCARVVYQVYEPPVICWRYGDEQWNEIRGDSYTVEQIDDLSQNTGYVLVSREAEIRNGLFVKWKAEHTPGFGESYYNGISSWRLRFNFDGATFYNGANRYTRYNSSDPYYGSPRQVSIWLEVIDGDGVLHEKFKGSTFGYWGVRMTPFNPNERSPKCLFKIFQGDSVVYQELREDCPEVEELPCRLSETINEITINKIPYLQRIEVRDQSIDTIYVSPLNAPLIKTSSLPDNCLNIYNTYTLAPPILSEYVPIPGAINPYQFINQICSSEDCPPPKYEVICDCDCRACPPNSCASECGDRVCCNDETTGILVDSIPIEEYCEVQL